MLKKLRIYKWTSYLYGWWDGVLNQINKIKKLSYRIRKNILDITYNSGEASHIGGALSMTEILAVVYSIFNIKSLKPLDRFILSKGHGFLALLSVLYCKNFIKKKKAFQFQKNGSEFIAHPIMNKPLGIETSNGSLGQGLSFGVGLAISYKKKNNNNSIIVIVGDGECYEGSIWEAAITATENNLNNLFIVVDCNGHQNDGTINKMMNYREMKKKWLGFGWNVNSCDGHNISAIINAFKKKSKTKPTAIIAKTTKGKGVDFMENNNDWHHGRLTKNMYLKSLKLIKKN
jgi:transketolase